MSKKDGNGKEKILQKKLYEHLQTIIEKPFLIGMEVAVPYKHVYLPCASKAKLEVWCFNQDILVYQPLFEQKPEMDCMDMIIQSKGNKTGMPFVILEIKDGQPTTEDVLAYSKKAEMIKSVFPYCRYVFLVKEKCDPRTYRLGTVFDKIIELKNEDDPKEIEGLKRTIKALLEEANDLAKKM